MLTRAEIPVPGLLWGDYPERRVEPRRLAERCAVALRAVGDRLIDRAGVLIRLNDRAWLAEVRHAETELARLQFDQATRQVRQALLQQGLHGSALVQAFGLASLAMRQNLGLTPFDTQLIAARTVLDNQLAEMATGEGKTLAVCLAASVGALAGMPVHVITANDYLVARDAQHLQALYASLGISVGWIVQPDNPAKRGAAYACDITYVTAKELVFDYLRDSLTASPGAQKRRRRDALAAPLARLQTTASAPALMRGLCLAIVDEADAILIDEARVPLILSARGGNGDEQQHIHQALELARTMSASRDFTLDRAAMLATLTEDGRERLESAAADLAAAGGSQAWRNRLHREHAIASALAALHLYQPERQYLVRDGKVLIIDETTGRIADGRVWSKGLQQFIELKEGCEPSPAMVTLAQLTYQRFFPRYVRLGGLSGTLLEARSELLTTYRTSVRRIALRRPCLRETYPARLFPDHPALWNAVVERISTMQASGRPVLVAADSVADAQTLADILAQRGLPHAVLHARNDLSEAQTVAQAGQRGAITVTTNMSGRGTDIELGEGVAELGGLHVICCQLNSARRIDRQLAGRAARQGDPGSVETMLSLDTTLLARSLPAPLRTLLRGCATRLPARAVHLLARLPQAAEETRQRTERSRLIAHDERSERQLGFGGASE